MREDLKGIFDLSVKRQTSRSGGIKRDVGISIQKKGAAYGFVFRNDIYELIFVEGKNFIQYGLRGHLLYFIPVTESQGFALHRAGKKDAEYRSKQHSKYATINKDSMPDKFHKYVNTEPTEYEMKYDKNLELYYIDLLEGETN